MMSLNDFVPLAVQVGMDTLEMHHELVRLRDENKELLEYRKKYFELLNSDIEHGQRMAADLMKLALKEVGD